MITNTEQIEEWRSIAGYEGLYEVSSLGRVRSWHRMGGPNPTKAKSPTPRVLKPGLSGDGYWLVILVDANRSKCVGKIHRLVAAAFLGDSPSKRHEVNHIDGCKDNNALSNLEYVTRSENIGHARRMGLYDNQLREMKTRVGERHHNSIITDDQAREMIARARRGDRRTDIASTMGVSLNVVYKTCGGKSRRHLQEAV